MDGESAQTLGERSDALLKKQRAVSEFLLSSTKTVCTRLVHGWTFTRLVLIEVLRETGLFD